MYGFFSDTEGKNYFGHFSAIQMEGFKTSDEGQRVRFEVQESSQGSVAASVQPI
jgi:CspA family cold shock protein